MPPNPEQPQAPQSQPQPSADRRQAQAEQTERNKDQVIQSQKEEIERLKRAQEERERGPQQTVYRTTYERVRRPLGKLLLGGAIVVNPILGIGLYAAKKTADKTLSKVPVAGDILYNKPMQMISYVAGKTRDAIASVVAAPALALDATKMTGKGLYKIADYTILELYRDLKNAINHKFNFAEDTNLLASAILGIKAAFKALTIFPFRLLEATVNAAVQKPLASLATLVVGYGFLSNPVAFIHGASALIEKIVSILGNLISKIPAGATP